MCPRPFRTMSSSILHSCPFCAHVTDISEILADFVGNPHCTQCGLSASEGDLKAQDDLVALFNTHMNMEVPTLPGRKEIQISSPPVTYSITQHYHHSAHVAQRANTSGPGQRDDISRFNVGFKWVFETLKRQNVDPSSLSPGQLELFANAMPEQQSRLIQMWQICPEPGAGARGGLQVSQVASTNDLEMDDLASERDSAHGFAEPYMLSGYDLIAGESRARRVAPLANEPTTGSPYNLSRDPIYQTGGQRWWERTQDTAMEY
ncbi:uncharacterized protein BJX67DRAFT_360788 [Aspergillus lucknowensis]|uniref:Uncharacterized protein n=1 Tax=Aspergillus lucknowensis TaxID=176173 RepID=A0ABR4LJ36_9EURO